MRRKLNSIPEETFAAQLTLAKIPHRREYRFAAVLVGTGAGLRNRLAAAQLKDWRFDFALPELQIGLEIEGGIWSRGRHVRGIGYRDDCEKYTEAAILGWRIMRFVPEMVMSGYALSAVKRAIIAARQGDSDAADVRRGPNLAR